MARTLVLLRHAKSDWPVGTSDIDRPLAERGRRDAPVAGALIRERVGAVDCALVSPAVRTQRTWALVHEHVDAGEIRTESAIYEASATALLDLVRMVPDSVGTALIVGHNPGLADLASLLTGSGDMAALERIETKFPTCGVAILQLERPWREATPGCAAIMSVDVPRG